jgi:hypothetical protein
MTFLFFGENPAREKLQVKLKARIFALPFVGLKLRVQPAQVLLQ